MLRVPLQETVLSDRVDEAPTIVYLNYVIGRPSRFAAAVVVRDSVGIVGWDNNAPICDTCTGSGERRRSCVHSKAFRMHVDKDRGTVRAGEGGVRGIG